MMQEVTPFITTTENESIDTNNLDYLYPWISQGVQFNNEIKSYFNKNVFKVIMIETSI